MPIVKSTLNGDSVSASAVTSFELAFNLVGGTVTTNTLSNFSPLRIKGMETIAVHVQLDGGTVANMQVFPQVSIRRQPFLGAESLRFFDLDAGTVVGMGGQVLLQFTTPADYIRLMFVTPPATTASGFVRIMCGA